MKCLDLKIDGDERGFWTNEDWVIEVAERGNLPLTNPFKAKDGYGQEVWINPRFVTHWTVSERE